MTKKISPLIVAAALALAVPATAAASTGLTSPAGTLVPVGTVLVGTNTNTFTAEKTGIGTLNCNSVVLRVEVTKNGSSGVEVNSGKQTSTATNCFQNTTTPITVDNLKIASLASSSSESSTFKLTGSYIAHVGSLNCTFQLSNATGTYKSNEDLLTFTQQPQTVSPAACGGGGVLSVSFTWETTAKATVLIMS